MAYQPATPLVIPTTSTYNTMRWPPWTFNPEMDNKRRPVSWNNSLNVTHWSHLNIVPTLLLTTTILASVKLYSSYLRRIPNAAYIQPGFFRKRSLFGIIHIRIAGIDAPEAAHFGKPAQPLATEALTWLKNYTLNQRGQMVTTQIEGSTRTTAKAESPEESDNDDNNDNDTFCAYCKIWTTAAKAEYFLVN
ncbi:hypothetical protein B7463_g5217, partial [Scytalidium lignicola]